MSPTGLYPRKGPRPSASQAEKKLFAALRNHLPPGWTAWHSLKVRVPKGREAEGDFLVAVPHRGLVVLEVKGGRIEVEDGQWLQNGRRMDKVPRDQAHAFKRALLEVLALRHPDKPLPFVTVATVFPDTAWDKPPTHGDLDGAVLGEHDLLFLNYALPALVERLFKDEPAPDWPWVEAVHVLWGESWVPTLSLGLRTQMTEAQLVALDEAQRETLANIEQNPRVFVAGRPGTGKTLLAMEIARRWEARGKRPLVLCHTRALMLALQRAGHEAATVRELAADVLERGGIEVEGGADRASWSPEVWDRVAEKAAEVVARHPLPYDALVIDEAQDLDESDWRFIRAASQDKPLWVFGDEGQAFWQGRRGIPDDARPFVYTLGKPYRCPKQLAAFAERYRPGANVTEAPIPIEELTVLAVEKKQHEAICAALIDKLVDDGVLPEQIAVLSLAGQTKTVFGNASRIGSYEAVRADDENAGKKLVADTFLRFKGLERPWIIVTELGLATTAYEVRMHIALTRATVGCIVLATPEEAERDPHLRAIANKRPEE